MLRKEDVERLKEEYPKGTRVELIFMGDDPQKVPVGTLGIVTNVDDIGTVHISWSTGSSLGAVPGVDVIRKVDAKVIVHNPKTNRILSDSELTQWANDVHRAAGGKGSPFSSADYPERLKGCHCNCGVTEDGYSNGEFVLLPKEKEEVKEGGKAYMRCIKCGCYSHL